MLIVFLLGVFPNPKTQTVCRVPSCTECNTVFVAVQWRTQVVLVLCKRHASIVVDAISEGVGARGQLLREILEPRYKTGEYKHVQQNFTYPVLGTCSGFHTVVQHVAEPPIRSS